MAYNKPAKLYTYNNKTLTLIQWSKEVGIDASVLQCRKQLGWTLEKMFTTPVRNRARGNKQPRPSLDDYLRARQSGEPVMTALEKYGDKELPASSKVTYPLPRGLEACDESEAIKMDGGLKLGIAEGSEFPDSFASGSSVTFLRLMTSKQVSLRTHRPASTDERVDLLEQLFETDEQLSKLTAHRASIVSKLSK